MASFLKQEIPTAAANENRVGYHNKKGQDTSKDPQILYLILYASLLARAERRYPPPVTPKPQPLRINDTKNPAAVAIEFKGRPCSNASGIRVSASEARIAPFVGVPESAPEDNEAEQSPGVRS